MLALYIYSGIYNNMINNKLIIIYMYLYKIFYWVSQEKQKSQIKKFVWVATVQLKKLHAKRKVKGQSTRSTVASRGRFIALAVDWVFN